MKTSLKKHLSVVVVLSLLMTLIVGCTSETLSPSESRVLTVLQGVDATTLDPAMHADSPTGNIEYQIFDTLLERDEDMNIKPCVALSWELVNDTTWKFTLRDNIYFHDGTQLTANDVQYSVERILNPDNKSASISNYKAIDNVEVTSSNTLIITTKQPSPILLSRLSELRIVPKHYIEEVGNETFAQKPIGSGAYLFKEWVKDEYVLLEANQKYWRGVPSIKQVVFKPVPEASARIMALISGEADIITNVPPHQVAALKENDDVGVSKVDSTRFIMLPFGTDRPAVKNVKVRQAINYAIDVESIVKNILDDNATISSQPVCNFDHGYNPNIKPYGYNPELARQLLDESGNKDGLKIVMKAPSGRYLMDKEVAEAIKLQLEKVGIEVKLIFEEWGSYVSSLVKGSTDADIWLLGWGSSTYDAGTTLYTFLHTKQPIARYDVDEESNTYIDATLDQAMSTMENEEREQMYHQVIEHIYSDAAFINLYQQVDIYGVNRALNWHPRSDELIVLRGAGWQE